MGEKNTLVHSKDEFRNHKKHTTQIDVEMSLNAHEITYPEWTIDEDGIPYCTQQTNYTKIMEANLKKRFPHEFEKMLHCQHCDHYKNNDCYFPKTEIDKIERDRNNLTFRCQLCGMKIDRVFSILMSLYYKQKFGVTMPVICCACYASLENNSFEKNSKRRMILFVVSLVTSLYFLFTYFLSLFSFNWMGILFFVLPFAFWGYISIRDLKNIYYLYQGRKYYKKLMNAAPVESKTDSRQTLMDDDDKEKPKDGAFYSPGYDY